MIDGLLISLGQLEEYRQWKGRVVLFLIGETAPNFRKQLKKLSEDNAAMFEPCPAIFDK